MSISLNGRNSRRRPQKGMKRKHFVKLNGKENRNCFVYKKDRNENYRETDNYNGIIVSLLSINLSTSSKVSVECGMKEEREKRVWEMMWWLRYIAWIMKSCICKERTHWKQRPKNIYDVDKKIKAYTWKWDLFRLKQRTYTSLGVVIVPHVNCTQNDGTKCSFFTGSNRTNRCIMICIRKHIRTFALHTPTTKNTWTIHTIKTNIYTNIHT